VLVKTLPKSVIDQWPEVLKDVVITAVPLLYIQVLTVKFNNGKIWSINVSSELTKRNLDLISKEIEEFVLTYTSSISLIDFTLDIDKLKNDSLLSTNNILKSIYIK
jgi:hypothetical protein